MAALEVMDKQANITGMLARTGFDAVDAAKAAGLPAIKHTGLTPVTVKGPDDTTAPAGKETADDEQET